MQGHVRPIALIRADVDYILKPICYGPEPSGLTVQLRVTTESPTVRSTDCQFALIAEFCYKSQTGVRTCQYPSCLTQGVLNHGV
jgi:hypothetical protein